MVTGFVAIIIEVNHCTCPSEQAGYTTICCLRITVSLSRYVIETIFKSVNFYKSILNRLRLCWRPLDPSIDILSKMFTMLLKISIEGSSGRQQRRNLFRMDL